MKDVEKNDQTLYRDSIQLMTQIYIWCLTVKSQICVSASDGKLVMVWLVSDNTASLKINPYGNYFCIPLWEKSTTL